MTVFRCATESHSHSMWLLTHHQQLAVEHSAPSAASIHCWNKGNRFRCKRAHRTEIVIRKFSFESKFCGQNILSMTVVHSLVSSLRILIVAINGKGNSHRLHAPASELMCHKLPFHRSHHSSELCEHDIFDSNGRVAAWFRFAKQYGCRCLDLSAFLLTSVRPSAVQTTNRIQ